MERTTRFEPATLTLARYADLFRRPAQTPGNRLWPAILIDRWFALFHDVSRPEGTGSVTNLICHPSEPASAGSLSEHLNPLSVWEKPPGCLCNVQGPNSIDRPIAIRQRRRVLTIGQ